MNLMAKDLLYLEYADEATELRKRIVRLIAQLDRNRDWVSEKSIERLETLYEAALALDVSVRADLRDSLADDISLSTNMR